MSNALAIATVTTALAQIVRAAAQEAVSGADVVTGRPDAAGNGPPLHKVHLYLYQVSPNGALRNADLPSRRADGKLTQRAEVQAAAVAELTQLLTTDGLHSVLLSGGALPSLRTEAMRVTNENDAPRLGTQIARAV